MHATISKLMLGFPVRFQNFMCAFAAEQNWLNWIAPVLLAPLFGVPCGLYRFHHCMMHHAVRQQMLSFHGQTSPQGTSASACVQFVCRCIVMRGLGEQDEACLMLSFMVQ